MAARLDRLQRRCRDPAGVISFVDVKILVFGGNEGLFHKIRDVFGRDKQAAFLREFVDQVAFAGIDSADGRRLVLCQRFVAGQVTAVHPEHAAHGQREHGNGQRHKAEDAPEKGKDEPDHACASDVACAI